MSRPACQGTRKDGATCRAPALPGSPLCWAHDPSRAEQAARARTEGASKGGRLRALRGRRPRLDNARALTLFASDVVQDVLSGTVQPDVGRCVLYGCATLRQLVETSDLAKRLEALEQQLAAQAPKGTNRWA